MPKKFGKYWLNFSALLLLAGLFALPFFSFAKFKSSLNSSSATVLSASTEAKVFSNVVFSEIIEATFSQKERTRSFDPVTTIKNPEIDVREYRLVLKEILENEDTKESSKSFDAIGYFTVNGKDTTVLNPNEVSDLVVQVDRINEKRGSKFLILVLSDK